jgi:hypothetical protein
MFTGLRLIRPANRKFVRELNLLQVFADSVKRQVEENKDFKKKLELLGDSSTKTSETLSKNASVISKAASETAAVLNEQGKKILTTIDPVLAPLAKTATATGEAVASGIQKTYSAVDSTIAQPISKTETYQAYKQVKKQIIESPLEIAPKGERVSNFKPLKPIIADEASSALQTVKQPTSSFFSQPKWMDFKETEQAKITRYIILTRLFKNADANYDQYKLQNELTRYICPELIEAYLDNDLSKLEIWTSQRVHQYNKGVCASIRRN